MHKRMTRCRVAGHTLCCYLVGLSIQRHTTKIIALDLAVLKVSSLSYFFYLVSTLRSPVIKLNCMGKMFLVRCSRSESACLSSCANATTHIDSTQIRFATNVTKNVLLAFGIICLLALIPCRTSAAETDVNLGIPMLDSANHLLDAGDYILIQLSLGKERYEYDVQLDAEGDFTLPLVGTLNVKGMTSREASSFISRKYSKFYKTPYVSILIRQYGQFEVFVFGPDFPGRIIRLNNGTRLLNLIISENYASVYSGAFRRVHLIRSGIGFSADLKSADNVPRGNSNEISRKPVNALSPDLKGELVKLVNATSWVSERLQDPKCKVQVVDPLALSRDGELSQFNLNLQDKDVVFIPSPERFVDVSSEQNPRRIELLEEETLGAILRLIGSVNFDFDLANTVVQRYDKSGQLTRVVVNLYKALDDVSQISSFKLQNRDKILFIPQELRVFVLGEVKLAGAFDYKPNSTVLDYISLAGGGTELAHLTWIAVIRQPRDLLDPGAAPEVFTINFRDIHAGRESGYVMLMPGDVIYVPPKGYEFRIQDVLVPINTIISGYAAASS